MSKHPRLIQSARVASYITQPFLVSDPSMVRRIDLASLLGQLRVWTLVFFVAGCGPPLTQPSSRDITGQWASTDRVFTLFDITLDLTQNSDGTVTGTWSSKVEPPHPACPPDLGDPATGPVQGTNTVLSAQFGLIGAGDFQGQRTGATTLRGSLVSCGGIFPITFTRVSTTPAG
jgi:hypothetical protein